MSKKKKAFLGVAVVLCLAALLFSFSAAGIIWETRWVLTDPSNPQSSCIQTNGTRYCMECCSDTTGACGAPVCLAPSMLGTKCSLD